jgi:hypothetical protein
MLRVLHVKTFVVAAVLGAAMLAPSRAFADPLLFERFNNISTLGAAGWAAVNNSSPAGLTGWFQGNPGVFAAQEGAPNSYIAANFLNAGIGGNIDNWLMLPELELNNGDTLSFYTRSNGDYPDNLEVRFSGNGASTNTADFTTLNLAINPALSASGYPTGWTLFTVTLSGLSGATNGRFAFRYVVPDTNTNGDYIGIDSVQVNPNPVPEPASMTLLGIGLAGLGARRFRQSKVASR